MSMLPSELLVVVGQILVRDSDPVTYMCLRGLCTHLHKLLPHYLQVVQDTHLLVETGALYDRHSTHNLRRSCPGVVCTELRPGSALTLVRIAELVRYLTVAREYWCCVLYRVCRCCTPPVDWVCAKSRLEWYTHPGTWGPMVASEGHHQALRIKYTSGRWTVQGGDPHPVTRGVIRAHYSDWIHIQD